MKPNFSIHEEDVKKNIEEYLKLYKKSFNTEKDLLKQIKDNIEMFDFLNFKDSANNINQTLRATWKNVRNSLVKYQGFLNDRRYSIQETLSNMTVSSQKTKNAIYLKKICDDMNKKIELIDSAKNCDIISLIMIWKNISKIKAIIEYCKNFPITVEIKKEIFKVLKQNVKEHSSLFIICSLILLILSIALACTLNSILLTSLLMIISITSLVISIIVKID